MAWILLGLFGIFAAIVSKFFDVIDLFICILMIVAGLFCIFYGSGAFSGVADMTIKELVRRFFEPLH